jgi:NAD(P)H-hydrate epimerase
MSAIDRAACERFGIPTPILMENAGLKALGAMQQRIWRRPVPEEPVTVVSGRGNNGGDALVIARQLHAIGASNLTVLLSHGEPADASQCAANLAICRALGITVLEEPADAALRCGWVIDGMAGTGQRGALRGPAAALAERINRSRARVIALDAPSGVGDRFAAGMPSVRADWTLALELPKRALYLPAARPACGSIIVVPLGFPAVLTGIAGATARLLGPAALSSLLPAVRPDAHKGMRGHVAVLAGSAGTAGAARLAATAAGCSRAGLVTLHADADTYPIQAGALTSVMVAPWSEAAEPGELTRRFDSVVVGPGWGTGPARSEWLQRLLALPCCGVLDADAITLLARAGDRVQRLAGRWVLTPHPGELARLLDATVADVLADPAVAAGEVAARFGAVVVLKGHVTCVAAPGGSDEANDVTAPRLTVVDGMQPWLATGGAGDVLAGVIGALLAGRGLGPYQAACAGVLIHAVAARRRYRERGWFLAEELPAAVSRVVADPVDPD